VVKDGKIGRWLVLALILSANLFIVGSLAVSRQSIWRDEFIYFDIAENIYQGQGYSTDFKYAVNNPRVLPPYPFDRRFLYPHLCALAFHVIGKASTKVCSLISLVFQAGQAVVLFYLGRELFDYRTGLLAAFLYSLNPWYHYLGTTALTDMTATFFYYLCLLIFLRYSNERTKAWATLGGMSFAMAFLAREEAILFGIFVVIVMLLIRSPKEHFLWFWSFFLAMFLLRGWYLNKTFGSFTYDAQPLPMLADWELFYSLEPHTWSRYLQDVGGVGGAMMIRVINYLTFAMNFFSDGVIFDTESVMGVLPLSVSLPFALAYLRKMTQEKRRLLIALGLLFLAQTMFTLGYPGYAIISAGSRHGQLVAPFLLLVASAGLLIQSDEVIGRLKSRDRRLLSHALLILKVIFIVNYALFCFVFSTINVERFVLKSSDGTEVSKITLWGREHLPSTAVLMTRKPQEAHYYSNRTAVSAPLASFADMMDYAERNGATHIVISHKERSWRPNLLPGILAYPTNFKLLHEEDGARIYEVLSYDFGSEKIEVAGEEELLSSYTNPLAHLTREDILTRKRRDNLSRSLRVWDQLLAKGKVAAQEWWDGVKYGPLNWLYKIVHRSKHRLEADFGKFRLLGYSLDTHALEDEGVLDVALYWQSLEPVEEDYIIVVKLVNDVYHVWGKSQGKLWGDEFWAGRWAEDLVIGDSHHIEILPATPPGLYRLEVNVVDPRSWQILEPEAEAKMLSEPLEIPRCFLSFETLDVEHPLGADLGDKVRLLGYNIESGFRPGDNIHLTLFWQCLEEMEQSYTVFTHLVDAGDHIVAQKDNPPVDGFYPTTEWEVGEIVRDQYDLVIPSDAPSGEYRLNVGMYLAETGERLNVLKDGVPLPDTWIPLQRVAVGDVE
jgi:4-amino-4-deoxy-L-arabinose transferase-like glycosyltransferase